MITLITTNSKPSKNENVIINVIKIHYEDHKEEFARRIGNSSMGITTVSEKFDDKKVYEILEYLLEKGGLFDTETELTFVEAIKKLSPILSEETLKMLSQYLGNFSKSKEGDFNDIELMEELAMMDIVSEIKKQCEIRQIVISKSVLDDVSEILVPLMVDDRGIDANYFSNIKMIIGEIFIGLKPNQEITHLTVAKALERIKGKDEARTIAIGKLKFLQMKQTSRKEL